MNSEKKKTFSNKKYMSLSKIENINVLTTIDRTSPIGKSDYVNGRKVILDYIKAVDDAKYLTWSL